MMFTKIANGNEELYNKLFTRYRYRAATIIAKWAGHMLHLMNVRNRVPGTNEESSDGEEPSSDPEDGEREEDEEAPALNEGAAARVDEGHHKESDDEESPATGDGDKGEESEGDSPDDKRLELTPLSDGEESSSSSEEEEEDQEGGASPDEQRMELTPSRVQVETNTLKQGCRRRRRSRRALDREVTRVQSEQAHKYMTRSRAKLLRNKT